jgi:hypothetical protein
MGGRSIRLEFTGSLPVIIQVDAAAARVRQVLLPA